MTLKRLTVMAACLCATVVLMGASGGCGSRLHKANVSAGAIAASLHTIASVNHTNQLETPEERTLVANYVAQAAAANDSLIGVLESANRNGGTVDKAAVLAAFDRFTAQFEQLNDLGILHIKNPQAQANFNLALASIRAEIATLQTLLDVQTSKNRSPLRRHPYAPLFALTLTPAEIEELIALAIAAGSELVPKLLALRGASDPEILAQARQDDQAAIAIAVSDGAEPPEGTK